MTKKEIGDILNKVINPRDLAREKFEAYKNYIISILEEIKEVIEKDNFAKIESFCFESPAGDGYGLDSSVIDFGPSNYSMDIIQATNMLCFYKMMASGMLDVDEKYQDGYGYVNQYIRKLKN
jgi:hypothetical protein